MCMGSTCVPAPLRHHLQCGSSGARCPPGGRQPALHHGLQAAQALAQLVRDAAHLLDSCSRAAGCSL